MHLLSLHNIYGAYSLYQEIEYWATTDGRETLDNAVGAKNVEKDTQVYVGYIGISGLSGRAIAQVNFILI